MAELDWDNGASQNDERFENCVLWGCAAFVASFALLCLAFGAGVVRILFVLAGRV